LKQDGLDFDKISINVFAEDLIENNKYQNLLYVVEKLNDMNFDHIAFEILETPGSFDSDELVKTMIVLKSITSVEFYLDDYGTGYSNLLRLLLLPISVVKFDRQILWGARNNDKAFLTAKTSIETFKNLDLKIAMEGVATPEDIEICEKLGIDYYQGYELAKPGDVTILYDFFKKAE
jgi:EAL domain-containing protein (putative c-di-GMP-specific phosphodiesterase class I)